MDLYVLRYIIIHSFMVIPSGTFQHIHILAHSVVFSDIPSCSVPEQVRSTYDIMDDIIAPLLTLLIPHDDNLRLLIQSGKCSQTCIYTVAASPAN